MDGKKNILKEVFYYYYFKSHLHLLYIKICRSGKLLDFMDGWGEKRQQIPFTIASVTIKKYNREKFTLITFS